MRHRQAHHQTHHHYYLNISVEAKRQIYQIGELNRIEKIDSAARIESIRIETFFARIGMLFVPASMHSERHGPANIVSVKLRNWDFTANSNPDGR